MEYFRAAPLPHQSEAQGDFSLIFTMGPGGKTHKHVGGPHDWVCLELTCRLVHKLPATQLQLISPSLATGSREVSAPWVVILYEPVSYSSFGGNRLRCGLVTCRSRKSCWFFFMLEQNHVDVHLFHVRTEWWLLSLFPTRLENSAKFSVSS